MNSIHRPRNWNAIDNEKHIRATKAGHAEQRGLPRITIQAMDQANQVMSAVADLKRSKPELIAENMLLRQQLIVLERTGRVTQADAA